MSGGKKNPRGTSSRLLAVLKLAVIVILFSYLFGLVISDLVPILSYDIALAIGALFTVLVVGVLVRTRRKSQS